ncbi:MAG: lytic murein transglycosylase B [Gammaproteobacteria bacterium]|nr:lytic murein transglycosylase B [Gammaproteobacteria bacterium]NIM73686.1 lytic murein transglycosylase B [Gammaproteobacteria bacterium]NIN37360.1 lytic murein transglycosylase B [Gammaproteobacteria bacterium]NIO25519.1 lytic murein transglycosylase B [Gammaproteobacteria bacterium]NIO66194.1 lytic murein transglycosylase B [Gammaproteobacteria bacterium]
MNRKVASAPGNASKRVSRWFRRTRQSLLWLGSLGLLACSGAAVQSHTSEQLDRDSEIAPFVTEMVSRHGFERASLERTLATVRVRPEVLEAIARPAESLDWYQYHPIFLTETRISKGEAFWRVHEETLSRASREYGVSPEIIVAIIGVETLYGTRRGRHLVLDSLATLAFRYPKRSKFFRSELEQFLVLARQENFDVGQIKGSYAGAMGIPQFISSSYRRYAVDFDGDGIRDLMNNPVDAIGSVANYLKVHGWRPGEAIALPASVTGSEYKALVKKGLKPHTPVSDMHNFGVVVLYASGNDSRGALIELTNKEDMEHWVGLQNFYAITRYNHSSLYAMAVFQLGRAIGKRYHGVEG